MSMDFGKSSSEQTSQMDPRLASVVDQTLMPMAGMAGNVPNMPDYYPGQNYIDQSAYTQDAIMDMVGRGQGSATDAAMQDTLQSMMGQQQVDLSGAQDAAGQLMGGLGAGQAALQSAAGMGLDDAAGFALQGAQSPYGSALQQQASGQVNPLTAAMFQQGFGDLTEQFQEQVMPDITSQFVAAGRSGSGTHQRALTDAAGELADAGAGMAANMFGQASESALGRQLQAAQAGLGDDLSRRALGADLYGQGIGAAQALQQGGAQGAGLMGDMFGQIGQQQLAAAGLAPTAQEMDYRNIAAIRGAGALNEQQAQRELDANMERYEYEAGRPLQDFQNQMNAFGQVMGAATPLVGFGTTSGSQRGMGKGK